MTRDLTAEPLFPTGDIQGDILVGLLKKVEKFVFFRILDGELFATFMRSLEITSMQECLDQRATVAANKAAGITALVSTPGLNVAFTYAGLQSVGVTGLDDTTPFAAGMAASATALGDPSPGSWSLLGPNEPVDGMFVVTGATDDEVNDTIALRLAPAGDNGWNVVGIEPGVVRPEPVKGHEHFGFADGVSQPAVRGRIGAAEALEPTTGPDENQADPGRDLLWPGEFLFGYPGQDPSAVDFTVQGQVQAPPIPFMANGAFLVFRKLAQSVPEFDLQVKARAAAIDPATSDPASAELLGAQMVGRWKSGAALIKAPRADNPSLGDGTPDVNDFEFGGDRDGVVCPWAAHIRKAYPRDDVRHDTTPANDSVVDAAEAFTQTRRMLRRGIAYGEELTQDEALNGTTTKDRGLLFACYVTDIGEQFEFVQEAWVNADDFSQPQSGVDAIIGQGGTSLAWRGAAPFSKQPGRKPDLTFDRFVHMQGGEYFFAPSIPALRTLPGK
jgi:Dyp-type peroxidase family